MKKIFIITLMIYYIYNLNSYEKYTNSELGFSFKIPKEIISINPKNGILSPQGTYCYRVKTDDLDNFKKEYYQIFKKEFFLEDLIKIIKNKEFVDSSNNSYKVFFIKDLYVAETSFYLDYPCDNSEFGIKIYKGEKIIDIDIGYSDPKCLLPKRYPDFFVWPGPESTMQSVAQYKDINKDPAKFYNLIATKDKRAPKELLKLQEYFEEVVKSLEFFEPTTKSEKGLKYFTSTINNLRFRESPKLDGKFIRLLVKGEKLELLERGKEETINGVKGSWLKVKTEKNEVGWAYSGYLEEIKK